MKKTQFKLYIVIFIILTIYFILKNFVKISILERAELYFEMIWLLFGIWSLFGNKKLLNEIRRMENESKENLQRFLDVLPFFLCVKDKEGKWKDANVIALKMSGLVDKIYKGKTDKELFGEYITCEEQDKEIFLTKESLKTEEKINEKTIEFTKVPVFKKNPEEDYLLVIGIDITDEVRYREESKEKQIRIESFIENNPHIVASFTMLGEMDYINENGLEILGCEKKDVLGKHFSHLIYEPRLEEAKAMFEKAKQGQKPVYNSKCVTKNGNIIDVKIKNIPIVINGRIDGVYVIAEDITEKLKAEEMYRKMDKLSVVGEMAASIAHEVRNPLTSLRGFVQILQLDNQEENKNHYFKVMLEELDTINFIVSEFMILARPEPKKFEKADIQKMIEDMNRFYKQEAKMKNVEIDFKYQIGNYQIDCQPNQLKQVILNIYKNATEAMPNGGSITVELTQDEEKVYMTFQDEGIGINENRLKKIGEPFYTTKEKGTGLGMTVSFKIIENHSGKIEFQSEENVGTIVKIELLKKQGK